MTRKSLSTFIAAFALGSAGAFAQLSDTQQAIQDLNRAIDIADAAWTTSIKGSPTNMYMADTYNTATGAASGPSDIWPLTAAVEAHCSILEALEDLKDAAPELYAAKQPVYLTRLNHLIDNLEYYKGSYRLSSYATSNKLSSPYAVPRSNTRGGANVTGILNVYDDQMWLCRELIRAYRLTGNEQYLQQATYLADYVLDGWDCWRDANGNEYGGITWGPGYNSKHACSNAPFIQPLTWLHDIYKDSGQTIDFNSRDLTNKVVTETKDRAAHYLDFAKRVYDWQKTKLLHSTGVYWDMMGADNTIQVSRGYRQHVDCGNPTGSLISYNTGTMLSGAAELYRLTGNADYLTDMTNASKASLVQFAKYNRTLGAYLFNTDQKATSGFNSWFNDVLMRSYADMQKVADVANAVNGLNSFQKTLDYAFENHNRNNLLPIRFVDGWGDETVTKAFHQFSFASQYAVLAKWHSDKAKAAAGISSVQTQAPKGCVYSLSGHNLGLYSEVKSGLSNGIYIVDSKKTVIRN